MSTSTIARIWGLSSSEKIYLMMYPEQAMTISDAAQKAFAETKRRFGRNDRNGLGDAFRHCLWSAMLSRDIGFTGAMRYTLAHEEFTNNPPLEKDMDLHNNLVGLKIGLAKTTDAILSDRCMSALRSGQLKLISE